MLGVVAVEQRVFSYWYFVNLWICVCVLCYLVNNMWNNTLVITVIIITNVMFWRVRETICVLFKQISVCVCCLLYIHWINIFRLHCNVICLYVVIFLLYQNTYHIITVLYVKEHCVNINFNLWQLRFLNNVNYAMNIVFM